MTSASLTRWQGDRSDLLDQLIAAHRSVGGTGAGRRWTTSELNRALLLRMASQFQGFAKDLHQETAVAFGSLAQPKDPAVARILAAGLQTNRELDRGNAHESALASDFGRFGLRLWDEMQARHSRTGRRREHLRWFNMARNALAHDDGAKLAKVEAAGYRVDLPAIRKWRSTLDGLAGTIDIVMAAHLTSLFPGTPPW